MQRIVVVDDHTVFAQVLGWALGQEADLECVGHAQSVSSGIAMVDQLKPDIVVMDVRLNDGDGIAATAELTEAHPHLQVVVLTAFVDEPLLQRAAAASASAVVLKDGDLGDILRVLRSARRGGFIVHPPQAGGTPVAGPPPPKLTRRDRDVLHMLAAGVEVRLIAQELGIPVLTCQQLVDGLLRKLRAKSQLEAVANAMRQGLLSDLDETQRG